MIAQTQESLAIGAERAHYQIYRVVEAIAAHQIVEGSGPILEANAESAVSQRATAKLEISETGSVVARYLPCPSKIALHVMVDGQERTMVRREKDSGTGDHRPPRGVKADHKDHKMEAQDLPGGNFRNAQLSSEHRLLRSKIANGARKCGLTRQLLNLLYHLVMAARLLPPLLLDLLHLSLDQS